MQLADDRIALNIEGVNRLLAAEGGAAIVLLPGDVIELDSAGEYRYRFVEHDRWRREVGIYERIQQALVED
ncbi:hypothetical protein [Actinophytocola sp.]|uniref:hypothetical protein n=1 Tax=Actinophytocola sp. TaxID=1872138 RepID=UPI002ED19CD9